MFTGDRTDLYRDSSFLYTEKRISELLTMEFFCWVIAI